MSIEQDLTSIAKSLKSIASSLELLPEVEEVLRGLKNAVLAVEEEDGTITQDTVGDIHEGEIAEQPDQPKGEPEGVPSGEVPEGEPEGVPSGEVPEKEEEEEDVFEDEPVKAVTKDDVRNVLKALDSKYNRQAVIALFKKFNVAKLKELPSEKYAEAVLLAEQALSDGVDCLK